MERVMRETMLVFCLRCGGFYDMDLDEAWTDHHEHVDGGECAPVPEKCTWVTDRRGRYCSGDHTEDWHLVVTTTRV